MKSFVGLSKGSTSLSNANSIQRVSESAKTIESNRPQLITQRKLQEVANRYKQPGATVQLRGGKAKLKHTSANWRGLPQNLQTHMMSVDGGQAPTGLHAYANGALPDGAILLKRVGGINSVHQIWWTTSAGGDTCKWSTMFPANLTEPMVTAILQKRLSQLGNTVDCSKLGLPYSGKIKIESAGATYFPSLGITPQSKDETITVGTRTYTVANHN
ncbi:hypothetical protein [Spirosoma rhododendri]|uniref:Uncharacterized protein n=1 Tax=Spirosoma rhododendri TaxID=2728024 RepID=A0A7L5DPG2_9BACT|nr:hypothetical protein [Spirosoma rhododendri]QJD80329.1 hypothetical protein HH216_19285 [Spirosoma rhododendri]